jgi:hypothetical protein
MSYCTLLNTKYTVAANQMRMLNVSGGMPRTVLYDLDF